MKAPEGEHIYRIGGNSCLSGDFMGFWKFDHELEIGENVIFEDMLHYTTVKTNTFNGITHPSIGIVHLDGNLEILREFRLRRLSATGWIRLGTGSYFTILCRKCKTMPNTQNAYFAFKMRQNAHFF